METMETMSGGSGLLDEVADAAAWAFADVAPGTEHEGIVPMLHRLVDVAMEPLAGRLGRDNVVGLQVWEQELTQGLAPLAFVVRREVTAVVDHAGDVGCEELAFARP